jgi:hypothetical protein
VRGAGVVDPDDERLAPGHFGIVCAGSGWGEDEVG